MGFVLLDLTFRAERAFKVDVPAGWHERLGIRTAGDDATLAQYHELLLALCREQGREPPPDSWGMLLGVVEDAVGSRDDLTPASLLLKDIAPHG